MTPWLPPLLALLGGYLLGAIPFGVVLTRLAGAQDPRTLGSGNIGATNVLRSGRKGLAAATLLLDGFKGTAAVLIAHHVAAGQVGTLLGLLAGMGAFYGHIFPVWLGFRGGKGVATCLGVALGIAWPCGLAFAICWLVVAFASRISSVGGMSGGIAATIAAVAIGKPEAALVLGVLSMTILWTHRANLARLIAGTEPKIGRS
jgi:glycerol-3-phosphate acyltransferase PlsY